MAGSLQPGVILAGKYRLDSVIGQGRLGTVVAGTHLHWNRRVALKFIHEDGLTSPEALQSFLGAARAAAALTGEHVARVLDVGVEGSTPYLVTEYLEGTDLAAVLADEGALPWPLAVRYVLEACEALAEAHARGIVHQGLRPANLFLCRRKDGTPTIKVLEFGISKLGGGDSLRVTKPRALVGSPAYIAPEQIVGAEVDGRADVWSFGALLYELVAGRPPFDAETPLEVCARVVNEAHRPLREVEPRAPAWLSYVVDRCLTKTPEGRWPTVVALAGALGHGAGPLTRRLPLRVVAVVLVAGGAGWWLVRGRQRSR